jgi:hypothetical protein
MSYKWDYILFEMEMEVEQQGHHDNQANHISSSQPEAYFLKGKRI